MENDLMEALRSAIKALLVQEVRLLRTEQACPSLFLIREMKRSIQETKDRVMALTRSMDSHERNLLIKRIIDQSVEEEIDEAIEARKNKCFRCIHIRYFDESGMAYQDLPCGAGRDAACDVSALQICCKNLSTPGTSCGEFVEKSSAVSLEEYLRDISFFYDVKEMLDRLDRIWEEYLSR
jgi:hypothetical protein